MRTNRIGFAVALLLLPLAARAAETAQPMDDGGKKDFLAAYDETAGKLRSLAEAIPEAKYGWAPTHEVRTVGQVVGHVAGAEYLFAKTVGAELPAGAPTDENGLENLKSKAELTAALDKALTFGRSVAESATPEMLAKQVNFFGNQMSGRGIMLVMYGHMSEHLGQLIAYARSVGVVPPWSK
jgi:uncharacterized damage-inducible protein DinB